MSKLQAMIRAQMAEGEPLGGPLIAVVHFRMPMPQCIKKGKRRMSDTMPHSCRPDMDNLLKFLFDCMKGIVFTDDSQIAWVLCSKTRSSHKVGGTVVTVGELENIPADMEKISAFMRAHAAIDHFSQEVPIRLSSLPE